MSLEEEVQERLTCLSPFARPTAQAGGSMVFIQHHSLRPEDFDTLVESIYRLARTVDMALFAGRRAQQHHHAVVIRKLLQTGVDQPATHRHHFYRLLAQQPASRIEIVNGHIAKDAARVTKILARSKTRVTARNHDLPNIADFALFDCPFEPHCVRVEAPIERKHHATVKTLDFLDRCKCTVN